MLTTPVVRCLKQQLPGVELHYLTKRSFAGILRYNPYITKTILLDSSWELMMHSLRLEAYDYVIDLHHNLRTLRIKRGLGAKSFAYNKLNVQKWLLVNFKINNMPPVHIVDRYMDTVRALGVVNDGKGLDYFIPEKDQVPLEDIPAAQSLGYIGVVIGAALNTKKLPVEKLRELCEKIDYPIILLGGPEDREAGSIIAEADPIKIYNSCGKFNLNESADLVRTARLVITHDTGLMHIAAAFGKPIISVWGNTVPQFGMTPYYGFSASVSHMMEVKGLSCRPCSKIGYAKCPRGHFKCMNNHDIDELAKRAMALVRR
ncbi:glycosyltransferase family 9 protein [Segetibacter sp. 3557_3]|uniref:glycosyltransferase family 9 protein n=1 Tax=Segetibacter sp. 3557_3 TaxID=2547429 RepID=UPI001FB849D3|nr:glycosyltransferase family 9 protein [Segetibacter sp. 3557_3]